VRIRTIKPSFWKDLDVCSLPVPIRLHYIGLWNYADDEGRGIDEPRLLKGELWPMDNAITPKKIEDFMASLQASGRILRYTSEGGDALFQVRNWSQHQVINRPQPSLLPPPTGYDISVNEQGQLTDVSVNGHGTVTDLADGKGREGKRKGREGKGEDLRAPRFSEFYDPYPRHSGRGAAERAFARAVNRVRAQGGDPKIIVEGVLRYAADPNLPEMKFIPHPATWLNQDRWADDPEPPEPRKGRPDRAAEIAADARGALP